jgi:hypothetical protein
VVIWYVMVCCTQINLVTLLTSAFHGPTSLNKTDIYFFQSKVERVQGRHGDEGGLVRVQDVRAGIDSTKLRFGRKFSNKVSPSKFRTNFHAKQQT